MNAVPLYEWVGASVMGRLGGWGYSEPLPSLLALSKPKNQSSLLCHGSHMLEESHIREHIQVEFIWILVRS